MTDPPTFAFRRGEVVALNEAAYFLADAVAHLARGFDGKGDGYDRAQGAALRQQRKVARDQSARFAGAGAGRDDDIALTAGGALLFVGQVHCFQNGGLAHACFPGARCQQKAAAGQ